MFHSITKTQGIFNYPKLINQGLICTLSNIINIVKKILTSTMYKIHSTVHVRDDEYKHITSISEYC